ncbi:hypothetical protein GCM10023187_51930 [Nibrella viscosa]|uniref:Uncharacterized protein n=2 Tax=Nibrella viscosa TaxID=1084524 RepID=A0ABP8KX56_9BACT
MYKVENDGDKVYSYFKIATVGKDTLWVHLNKYFSEKQFRSYKIDKTDNYEEETVAMPRATIAKMKTDGNIMSISR